MAGTLRRKTFNGASQSLESGMMRPSKLYSTTLSSQGLFKSMMHPICIVLEPEVASVYCELKLKECHFPKGSKFLVVDAGGGIVDLVVHEKVDHFGVMVKEVTCSEETMCGGTLVDKAFMLYLAGKIQSWL